MIEVVTQDDVARRVREHWAGSPCTGDELSGFDAPTVGDAILCCEGCGESTALAVKFGRVVLCSPCVTRAARMIETRTLFQARVR